MPAQVTVQMACSCPQLAGCARRGRTHALFELDPQTVDDASRRCQLAYSGVPLSYHGAELLFQDTVSRTDLGDLPRELNPWD